VYDISPVGADGRQRPIVFSTQTLNVALDIRAVTIDLIAPAGPGRLQAGDLALIGDDGVLRHHDNVRLLI
jgi:hypothetical protein